MGDHDALSVAGQIAGMGEKLEPWPPEKLIEAFCTDVPEGYVADAGERREPGYVRHRGFCGYTGSSGGPLASGFDDGYDWMGHLTDHGWRPLPNKGDWPYVVYMHWRRSPEQPQFAIAEYCEADLNVWLFDDVKAMKKLYGELRDCP